MKTIGLIGGLSWQSTQSYYHIINSEVNKKLGGNHSARIVMYSFDFQEIEQLQYENRWEELNRRMGEAGLKLEKAGAECLLICSNTMHECAGFLETRVAIPLIHIADSVGKALEDQGIRRAGLLGTRFLMRSDTYAVKLSKDYNIETVIPAKNQIEEVNDIIYRELVKGVIRADSKTRMLTVINNMEENGMEAIILGCTEIPLLIRQEDCTLPVIDSTGLHALSAVDYALKDSTAGRN